MKKEYILHSKKSIENDFDYVFSPCSKTFVPFTFEDGQAVNRYDENIRDYEYISIVTKEKYSDGVTIKTECSFDKYGAPLIVLTDDIQPDEQGKNRYGLHFEVHSIKFPWIIFSFVICF